MKQFSFAIIQSRSYVNVDDVQNKPPENRNKQYFSSAVHDKGRDLN